MHNTFTGDVSTVAGNTSQVVSLERREQFGAYPGGYRNGEGAEALFNQPVDLAVTADGNHVHTCNFIKKNALSVQRAGTMGFLEYQKIRPIEAVDHGKSPKEFRTLGMYDFDPRPLKIPTPS